MVHIAVRSVQGSLSYPEGVILAAILDGGGGFHGIWEAVIDFRIKGNKIIKLSQVLQFLHELKLET